MKIFVGNLSFQITESELEATFAQHGVVTDVKSISGTTIRANCEDLVSWK